MTILEKTALLYEKATNREVNAKSFTIGKNSSWTARQAVESLQFEPTGALGVLLLRKAWNEYLEEEKIHPIDILSSQFESQLSAWKEFDAYLREGEPNDILSRMIQMAQGIATKFGIPDIQALINNESKFIDILKEAYQNIYEKYTVDPFRCIDIKEGEPFVGIYEYRFKTLKNFVDCLRRSDNCLVYARIDGVFDYGEDLTEYDTFFAFGCRIGDRVYINSNRAYDANPSSRKAKLGRNPAKKLRNEAGSSWMPYYDVMNGKQETSNETAIVITNADIQSASKIADLYDDEAKLILCLSLAALYQKYYIDKAVDVRYNYLLHTKAPVEDCYFNDEIKLLPNTSTALVKANEIQLPITSRQELEIVHPTLNCSKVTYYDWYIKEYIKEDELCQSVDLSDFIGTKGEAERRVWWTYRHQALGLVNERRTKEIAEDFYSWKHYHEEKTGELIPLSAELTEGFDWYHCIGCFGSLNLKEGRLPAITFMKNFDASSLLQKNALNIIKYCLTRSTESEQSLHDSCKWKVKIDGQWKDYADTNGECFSFNKICANNLDNPDFDASTLDIKYGYEASGTSQGRDYFSYVLQRSSFYREGLRFTRSTPFGVDVTTYENSDVAYIVGDKTQRKQHVFELTANTVWDLCFLLGVTKEQLPKSLHRWLSSKYNFLPYTGNSLLDVTDPMDDVFDWVNNCIKFKVYVLLSNSEIKGLCKQYDIKSSILTHNYRMKEGK